MSSQLDNIITSLESIYSDLSSEVVEDVVNDAMYLYIRLRRCDEDITFKSSELNWIKRASKELLDKIELEVPSGVTEYSESVYKLKFDSTSISQSLKDEVVPLAKVYRFSNDVEDTTSSDSEESEDDA